MHWLYPAAPRAHLTCRREVEVEGVMSQCHGWVQPSSMPGIDRLRVFICRDRGRALLPLLLPLPTTLTKPGVATVVAPECAVTAESNARVKREILLRRLCADALRRVIKECLSAENKIYLSFFINIYMPGFTFTYLIRSLLLSLEIGSKSREKKQRRKREYDWILCFLMFCKDAERTLGFLWSQNRNIAGVLWKSDLFVRRLHLPNKSTKVLHNM